MSQRNRKLTIVALVIAVLTLSVGFAAFSSSLSINLTATVTPLDATFKVVFSTNPTKLETNEVTPTKTPSGITATNGIIDNTSGATIKNLNAGFTEPGQKVEYNFYVYNAGEYIAYLNSITYRAINGTNSSKVCTSGIGATDSYVQSACNSIKLTVKVGDLIVDSTMQNIIGQELAVNENKPVKVTIEYLSSGTRADGPFTVNFGDISVYYATTAGKNELVPRLPEEYQEVEWIATDGNSWFVSNFTINNLDRFTLYYKYSVPTNTNTYMFGADGTSGYAPRFLHRYRNLVMNRDENKSGNYFLFNFLQDNKFHEYKISCEHKGNIVVYEDGKFRIEDTFWNMKSYRSFGVFCNNYANNPSGYKAIAESKIAQLKFVNDETGMVVFDPIPCYRKSDGAIGMYDLVSGVFFTNQGTGQFTKGPDVK